MARKKQKWWQTTWAKTGAVVTGVVLAALLYPVIADKVGLRGLVRR